MLGLLRTVGDEVCDGAVWRPVQRGGCGFALVYGEAVVVGCLVSGTECVTLLGLSTLFLCYRIGLAMRVSSCSYAGKFSTNPWVAGGLWAFLAVV